MWKDKHVEMWVCGFITGALLMVVDELINLSLYCGLRCDYAIPFVGLLDIWDSWTLTFIAIFTTVFATLQVMNTSEE